MKDASQLSPGGFWNADPPDRDLRGRSVRGGAAMVTMQACSFLLNIASTAVLARLLTPNDFGLIAMAVSLTGFVSLFKDMGLTMAMVQKETIDHGQISTLFWINVAFSLVLVCLVAAIAPAVAWFYHEARLTRLLPVLALGFICSGLAVQHQALMMRKMRFFALAAIEIISLLLGTGLAIVMSLNGLGYWALVGKQLLAQAAIMAGLWLACGWCPGRPQRQCEIRSMLTYGWNLTGSGILTYLSRNLDKVLIGWRWGAGSLGFYDKGYQLLYLPVQQFNNPVSSVAIPVLSRLQNDAERFRDYYIKGLMLLAALGMPVVVFLFTAADKVVLTLLGNQWVGVIPIFRALGPAAFLGTFNMATGWVYVSLGMTHRLLRWEIVGSTVMALAFAVGLRWGAVGVAAGCSIATVLLRYPAVAYCYKKSLLKVSDLATALWRPAVASVMSGAATYAADLIVPVAGNIAFGLLVDFICYGGFYVLIWLALPGGRRWMMDTMRLAMELRGVRAQVGDPAEG